MHLFSLHLKLPILIGMCLISLFPAWSGLGLCVQTSGSETAGEECVESGCDRDDIVKLGAFRHQESTHSCLDMEIQLEPVSVQQQVIEISAPLSSEWLRGFLELLFLTTSDSLDSKPIPVPSDLVGSPDLFRQRTCLRC